VIETWVWTRLMRIRIGIMKNSAFILKVIFTGMSSSRRAACRPAAGSPSSWRYPG
jgi:hypothetical protein